ncbi:MAG: IS200/IS605 family element transposase accessory protein TnpB [Planctomycetes bacterium]|nr:IS200/IS605 family element transposase accessory protein TnpB [Planctomycetota bacterium]
MVFFPSCRIVDRKTDISSSVIFCLIFGHLFFYLSLYFGQILLRLPVSKCAPQESLRDLDRCFASFSVKRKRGEYNRTGQDPAIGVDVGLNSFCVLSDGRRIESPKPLEHTLRLLKRRSKQHSRKKLGSANRKKSALRLARLHRRIRNKRKDFLHKLSTQLAKTRSVVVVEELNVRGMMQNHHLSRHIADSGWNQFFTMLSYKTKWYGSRLIKAPRFYPSSKTCCACGSIKPELSLKERQFNCEICGFTIDRDENAARNLEYLSTLLDSKHLTGTTGSSLGSYGTPTLRAPTAFEDLRPTTCG